MELKQQIRSQTKPNCSCCGSSGTYLYQGLQDRLFAAQGIWNLKHCNNKQCELLWLDPAPISEDLPIAYQNYYTHGKNPLIKKSIYSSLKAGYRAIQYGYRVEETSFIERGLGSVLGFFNFFKEHMDFPFIYFKHQQKGRLLELGVGNGDALKLFSYWGWQAEGIDFDPVAVEHAVCQGLKVYEGDLFTQKFASDSFDAIFSSHVLEHVPDPEVLIKESLRVLKPGGIFVAVTPNASSKLHHFFKSNWRGLEPPRHLNIFTPKALLMALKNGGFKKIDVASSNCSAIHNFNESLLLSQGDGSKLKNSSFNKFCAFFACWYLNLMHRFSPLSGEELVLIAYK